MNQPRHRQAPPLAQQWLTLDAPYALNYYYGLKEPNRIRFIERNSALLFTAPHAVHHYHSAALPDKKSDARTGGLCELLAEQLGVSTLAAASFFDGWDSWVERDDVFKRILTKVAIKKPFVIDLHGMGDSHGVDVCIGLGPNPNERAQRVALQLKAALSSLNVAINSPFAARSPRTVTSYVQSLGGDAMQIEIAARLRDPHNSPVAAGTFAHAMIEALKPIFNQSSAGISHKESHAKETKEAL